MDQVEGERTVEAATHAAEHQHSACLLTPSKCIGRCCHARIHSDYWEMVMLKEACSTPQQELLLHSNDLCVNIGLR